MDTDNRHPPEATEIFVSLPPSVDTKRSPLCAQLWRLEQGYSEDVDCKRYHKDGSWRMVVKWWVELMGSKNRVRIRGGMKEEVGVEFLVGRSTRPQ